MSSLTLWLKSHMTAILATAIAISKAGLLGKAVSTVVLTVAAAFGA